MKRPINPHKLRNPINRKQLILPVGKSVTIEDSLKRLENFEIKPDLFKYLIENYVTKIEFTDMKNYGTINPGNIIKIGGKSNSLEEISKTLIHETIHLGTGVFPSIYEKGSNIIEKRIESATNQSFDKYKKEYLMLVENLIEPLSAWDNTHWQFPPEIKNYSPPNEN